MNERRKKYDAKMKNESRCFGQGWEGIFYGICCITSYKTVHYVGMQLH